MIGLQALEAELNFPLRVVGGRNRDLEREHDFFAWEAMTRPTRSSLRPLPYAWAVSFGIADVVTSQNIPMGIA